MVDVFQQDRRSNRGSLLPNAGEMTGLFQYHGHKITFIFYNGHHSVCDIFPVTCPWLYPTDLLMSNMQMC